MHLFSENLAIEVASYYRNIVLGHGATPKVFTMVNGDGDQYLFFIDDLQMERVDEDQFLAYIVQQHDALTYARGTLVIVDQSQQFIEFAVVDKDDQQAIICSAELTRDLEDKPIALSEFEKTLVKRESIVFGHLYDPVKLSDEKTEDYESLWEEMKAKILHRSMAI
ncbi:hypothetical protein IEN92_06795 [Polynucleobacter sp. MWH-Creno-3A4]|uniref:hypothetical protein n=1 Tax=Polynucleobacter sp. MWH-Creno-3A4 TaxID=1855886 RepID=UPI001C0C28F2|nr:hypothetical protein [Polynucleobacter sp. MWH-Creno-3A4]MBU3606460.1 hypothetical protein [Polynucleobacter sp. MWH-Creno-3A4]